MATPHSDCGARHYTVRGNNDCPKTLGLSRALAITKHITGLATHARVGFRIALLLALVLRAVSGLPIVSTPHQHGALSHSHGAGGITHTHAESSHPHTHTPHDDTRGSGHVRVANHPAGGKPLAAGNTEADAFPIHIPVRRCPAGIPRHSTSAPKPVPRDDRPENGREDGYFCLASAFFVLDSAESAIGSTSLSGLQVMAPAALVGTFHPGAGLSRGPPPDSRLKTF